MKWIRLKTSIWASRWYTLHHTILHRVIELHDRHLRYRARLERRVKVCKRHRRDLSAPCRIVAIIIKRRLFFRDGYFRGEIKTPIEQRVMNKFKRALTVATLDSFLGNAVTLFSFFFPSFLSVEQHKRKSINKMNTFRVSLKCRLCYYWRAERAATRVTIHPMYLTFNGNHFNWMLPSFHVRSTFFWSLQRTQSQVKVKSQ